VERAVALPRLLGDF